jgi:hypothetical protein
MDKYAETAFMLIALGILVVTADMAVRLAKIQRELKEWHKEWKISLTKNDIVHNEEENFKIK